MKNSLLKRVLTVGLLAAFVINSLTNLIPSRTTRAADQEAAVYTDSLTTGWHNWSWNTEVFTDSTDRVKNGRHSLYFSPDPWGGLYLHADQPVDSSLSTLRFSLFSFTDNLDFNLIFYDAANQPVATLKLGEHGGRTVTHQWRNYAIDLATLKNAGLTQISGFALQETSGLSRPAFYLDNIVFTPSANNQQLTTPTSTPTPTSNPTSPADGQQPTTNTSSVYSDSLAADWENWSWASSVNLDHTADKFDGQKAISFLSQAPWAGFYLHTAAALTLNNHTLNFALKTGSPDRYQVILKDPGSQDISPVISLAQGYTEENSWKKYALNLSAYNHQQLGGFIIQDISGASGQTLLIDTISLTNNGQPTTPTSITPTPAPTTPPPSTGGSQVGAGYSQANGQLYQGGQPIQLRGVSWFGFETETKAPHGLWSRNWQDMIAQIKATGFNAVRLPFCPAALDGVTPTGIDTDLNPDLAGLTSLQIMDKVMEEFNRQGIYVLLDFHSADCATISPLWYAGACSSDDWVGDLKFVAARYKHLPYLMGIDLKNEPHGEACWGTGNTSTDWQLAAEWAGRAVLETTPNVLLFVQGVQENPTCSSSTAHWMGGNLEPQRCSPINLPKEKLVFSPHVYGPDVYVQGYFNDGSFPENLPAIWEQHFGFLTNDGYAVVPGEWGGKYGRGDARDKAWQDRLVRYFQDKGICDSFYWSWNPNSGDTGGILQDDWSSVWDDKVQMLNNYFNNCRR